ncbi:LysR family transcriptional regulator [Glutamicibacter sp. NPDC087344]|uniref:LysR family transcriptional regulator n=1 Tax=Glutamicibacter sp. NPDC087344 TaxID=3363994 RepID=UPI003822B567
MSLVDPAVEYFLAVYETGSVNAAARRLLIASSAVSRHIARLERELNVSLFERLPHGLKPTSEGNAFAAYARSALSLASEVTGQIRDVNVSPIVSIAGSEGAVHYLLPRAIALAERQMPGLRVRLKRAPASAVSSMVRDAVVDLGVTYNLSLASKVQVLLSTGAPVHAIMRRGHTFSQRPVLTFREISQFPLVLSPHGATSRALVDVFAATSLRGIDPAFETDDVAASLAYVQGSDAITLLSDISLDPTDKSLVVSVPMQEPEFQSRQLQLQGRIGAKFSPAAQLIAETIQELIRRPDARGAALS